MNKQKFHKNDHVRLTDDLGSFMQHFEGAGGEAIVIGSYVDQYGGGSESNGHEYTLYIKDHGKISWYHEHQMTLIKTGQRLLLRRWERERAAETEQYSNLDWVFENGPELVVGNVPGASVVALAECLGISEVDMWGRRGEGFVWYTNAKIVLEAARPFLLAKNKQGWLDYASS